MGSFALMLVVLPSAYGDARGVSFAETASEYSGTCEKVEPDPNYVRHMLTSADRSERRVALVIGNSQYTSSAPLVNPQNDAMGMANLLAAIGFTVYRGIDLDADGLAACQALFTDALAAETTDLSLFFYAGHGIQLISEDDVEKRNYMLATDARVTDDGKGVGFQQVDAIINDMRLHSDQAVFFYDACRNDPLGNRAPESIDGEAIRRDRGFVGAAAVTVEESATTDKAGIFIAYATAPNRVADDAWGENSRHSPFTQGLLNHLGTPGVSLKQAMSYVSNDVGELTDWTQTSWTASSLTQDLNLNGDLTADDAETALDLAIEQMERHVANGDRHAVIALAQNLPRTPPIGFERQYAELSNLLRKALNRPARSLLAHSHPFDDHEISTANERVVIHKFDSDAAGRDSRVLLYNLNTGQYIKDIRADDGPDIFITSARLSSDEEEIVITHRTYEISFWESGKGVRTTAVERSGSSSDAIIDAWLHSDSGILLGETVPDPRGANAGQWTQYVTLDRSTGDQIATLDMPEFVDPNCRGCSLDVYDVGFVSDGRAIIAAAAQYYENSKQTEFVGLWEMETGDLLWHTATMNGRSYQFYTVMVAPDIDRVVFEDRLGGTAYVFDGQFKSPNILTQDALTDRHGAPSVLVGDGSLSVVVDDWRLKLTDVETGEAVLTLAELDNEVIALEWSDEGHEIVAVTRSGDILRVPASGHIPEILIARPVDTSSNFDASYLDSNVERFIYHTSADGAAHNIEDNRLGAQTCSFFTAKDIAAHVFARALSNDGRLIAQASLDGWLSVFDLQACNELARKDIGVDRYNLLLGDLVFTDTGGLVVGYTHQNVIRIYNPSDLSVRQEIVFDGNFWGAAPLQSGRLAVVVETLGQKALHIYDGATRLVDTGLGPAGPTPRSRLVVASHNGHIAIAEDDRVHVVRFDGQSLEVLQELSTAALVRSMAFRGEGDQLLIFDDTNQLTVIDAVSGSELFAWTADDGSVLSGASFVNQSDDGSRLIFNNYGVGQTTEYAIVMDLGFLDENPFGRLADQATQIATIRYWPILGALQ